MNERSYAALCAVILIGAAPSYAQQPTSGMVSVELTEVSATLADRLKVDEAKMPMSIQVPPEVAAEVCGVAPGAPSPQIAPRGDGCMARRSSPALDKLITGRMRADDPATMGGPPARRD